MNLIEKLRAATEGSRELDAEIARALGWKPVKVHPLIDDDAYWQKPDQPDVNWPLPDFTRSIDTALTLVPDDHNFVLRTSWWPDLGMRWHVSIATKYHRDEIRSDDRPTAPLAICIAALVAREAK